MGGGASSQDWRFFLDLLAPQRTLLVFTTGLMLLQSGVLLGMPWLASRFSAALLASQPVTNILLGLFGLIIVQAVLTWLVGVRMQATAMGMIADGCTRLFDHLQSLPLAWHQERRRGDVLALLTEDMERLGWFASGTLASLLPLLVTCVGALLIMLQIEPGIGVGVAILVPAMYLALKLLGRRLRPLGRAVADGYAQRAARPSRCCRASSAYGGRADRPRRTGDGLPAGRRTGAASALACSCQHR